MSDHRYKILLVDDEPDILEFMEYNLKKRITRSLRRETGGMPFGSPKTERPDLIILDIMMPEMDGIETCRTLREMPEFRKTMIAFLTARNEDYSQIAGFDVGADDYITKPIKPRVLISRIGALFRRYDPTGASSDAKAQVLTIGDLQIDREQYLIQKAEKRSSCPGRNSNCSPYWLPSLGRCLRAKRSWNVCGVMT